MIRKYRISFLSVFFTMLCWTNSSLSAQGKLVQENKEDPENKEMILLQSKDTIALIDLYLEYSNEDKNNGQYTDAYEHLWNAMVLADAAQIDSKQSLIHDELGVLYSIYGQEEEAIKHKNIALAFVKKSLSNNDDLDARLGKAYFSLAVQYRKAMLFDQAMVYLDSCGMYGVQKYINSEENPYINTEKGTIYFLQNKLELAEKYLLKAKEDLENEKKHFTIIVYAALGDLYVVKQTPSKAIYYYEKSLFDMELYKSHTDFKADVLRKLAALYKDSNEVKVAYKYLESSTKIADSLFSIRSTNNSKMFEIKNKYQETIAEKDKEILSQELNLAKKNKIQIQLVFVLCLIFVISVLFTLVFSHKAKVKRLQLEKQQVLVQEKHNKEKYELMAETKSKELTVSALQLIEKDKKIESLLSLIKEHSPDDYGKVKQQINSENKDLWQSFNLRFTEVNVDFYKRLRLQHDSLTPTEEKHCALIKLKFDSKEMARLLNISVSSVHISRHRIRKKMGLERGDDLSNYIASI